MLLLAVVVKSFNYCPLSLGEGNGYSPIVIFFVVIADRADSTLPAGLINLVHRRCSYV